MSSAAGILEELEARFREEEERYLSPEDRARVEAALEFSRRAHEGQKRLSGEPYVTHCIQVARILLDLLRRRTDPVILQAALLHDVLEDNLSITFQDLVDRFGEDAAMLVDDQVTVAIQVNGKRRDEIKVAKGAGKAELEALVLALPAVVRALDGKPVSKFIVVPDRIVNIVCAG